MIKYHLLLALVLLLFIAWANAQTIEYATEWETHLYTQVEKTVDLPWFWDYQDLLASYAYNTCKVKLPWVKWKYSCENLVKTWNAENWGWKWNAKNTANSNGTHDGWLCQLNSAYHLKFMKSKWFNNPLAQLDYCLQVREDAKNKWKMPWYAYNVRHKRDRGIVFKDLVKTDETIQLQEPTSTMPDETQPYSEPVQTGCKRIWTAKEWQKVQWDSHNSQGFLKVLREWIVWKDEKVMVFICDN